MPRKEMFVDEYCEMGKALYKARLMDGINIQEQSKKLGFAYSYINFFNTGKKKVSKNAIIKIVKGYKNREIAKEIVHAWISADEKKRLKKTGISELDYFYCLTGEKV